MPHSPDVTPQPPRRPYRAVLIAGAGVGLVIALGSVATAIWGRRIINARVVPMIEDKIEEAIERPVELGKLEKLSFNGLRVGKSTLPAIATDESSISADTVTIDFDLRSLIFQKTFKPNIVLVRPNVSLVQQEDGQWLEISVPESSEEEALITTEIQSVKLQDAQVSVTPFIQDPNVIVPRESVYISNINVDAEFYGEASQQVYFELAGDVDRGRLNIEGEADLKQQAIKANVRSQQLPAAGINNLLPSLVGLKSGTLNSNLTVVAALADNGSLDQTSVDVQGTAQFQNGEVRIRDLAEPVRNIRAQLRFKGQQVTLENTGLQLGDVELLADGTVDWEEGYNLSAQIPEVSLSAVQTLAKLELPENLPVDAAAPFKLSTQVTGPLDAPNVRGRLANLTPLQVDKVRLATATADFVLPLTDFKLEEFELTELRLVPDAGGVILAQGQVDLSNLKDPSFTLTGTANLPADRFAQLYGTTLPPDTVIGQLTASLEAEGTFETQTAFAQWQLSESTFPGQGELTLADNRLVIDNTQLRVADGTVTANGIALLDSGDWQAALATNDVPVERFTPQAQGLLSANLDASGNLYELNLAKIEAAGEAAIANAQVRIPNLNQPLLAPGDWTTAFQWQGDRIAVETFTAPGVQANGTIGVDFAQSVPIGDFDLNVALQQFDLQPFNQLAPQTIQDYGQLAGLTSFNGQLTGTLDNPQLAGDARLENLALNDLVFQTLTGPVAFSLKEGGSLNLDGQQDRLQLALDSQFWPVSFEVRNQEFVARGYGQQDRQLRAEIVQLPLDKLNVRPVNGFGRVAGLLNATVDANLADFSNPVASGELTVVQPALTPVDAQQFAATFRYADNTAILDQGELLLDNSRYLLTGSVSLEPQLQYTGELTAAEGRIEDLVALVEKIDPSVFNLGDFAAPEGTAADLAAAPAELPAGSLLDQLEAFVAFVESQPKSVDESEQLVISPLSDLSGGFTGTIAVAADSLDLNDVEASFDLQGSSWEWGPYAPSNQFVVQGDIQQLSINLDSFLIKAEDTSISLFGQGDLDQLTGQLTVDSLPVALADYIYPLPVTAAGELDMVAQFDGSLTNPTVKGQAIVVDPQINDYPIEQVETTFNYKNASLDVAGDIAIHTNDAPITLRGSIPYALPFMTVQPATNRLAIKAVVPDDSFDVINTLTQDQVRWEAGRGEAVVQVDGTLNQPVVTGNLRLRDGVIRSEFLEDPVTNLTGDIQVDLALLDQQFPLGASNIPLVTGGVTIPKLQADVQEGQLRVDGQLPLSPFDQPTDGIKIALEKLPINYSGAIKSVFDGQIAIDGSVIAPVVGGNLAMGEGRISTLDLARQFRGSDAVETVTDPQANEPSGPISRQMAKAVALYREDFFGEENLIPDSEQLSLGIVGQLVSFNNFEIQLSDRLLIAGQPFFNLRASGDIVVDGPLANPRPEGEIKLESGWINLFSTQFRLDRREENRATFTPNNGIYPTLNATMRTRVQETDTPRVPPISETGFVSAEITENQNIDALGSVEYITIRASVVDLNVRELAQGSTDETQDRLAQVVVLESDPSRSQSELASLLGNNVFSGITTAGLTQLAGFVGAGNVVGFLNNLTDAIGFQSFSVFPTTDTATDSTAGIGIGVEAIFEVTDDINVSVLEILNNGNAPQFGLQYELTEELRLRGSSNLDDTEFRLEYRLDF